MVLSREEGAKRERERGRRQHRAVENGGWRFGFFKKRTNERTNERTGRMKKEKEGERRQWYLNVQIVARGNDASFGASDFRHRAWSDRDRRRHRQKVFLVVVSLSDWNEERRRCSKEGVLFFKKYNPKLLSAKKKKRVVKLSRKKRTSSHLRRRPKTSGRSLHNRTTPRAG